MKTIKNGKRANIGGESLEKRAILYTSAKLEEAQLLRNTDSSKDSEYDVFGNDDLKKYLFISNFIILFINNLLFFRFGLQFKDWGTDTAQLKEPTIMQRVMGWTEEWEKERHKKNDVVSKAMFVKKV